VPLPAAHQTPNLENQWLEHSNTRCPSRLKRREQTPAAEGGTMGEKLPRILLKVATSTSLLGSFTCHRFTTWDRGLYFPSGILVLFIYITRLASNKIFSPSNKIHREVGRAKDLSAPLYTPDAAYKVSRIKQCNIFKGCPVASFWGSVVSVHLYTKSLSHVGGQIKDLFHLYFACLLRIL